MTGSSNSCPKRYRGRFAPSPTGPLHMGSLAAATASFLRARQSAGDWLLRIEDIDPPREVTGASASFLTTLEQFGFEWDGPVTYQSDRHELYRDTLETLSKQHKVYPCQCSRKTIREAIIAQNGKAGIYPGTCLEHPVPGSLHTNWRFQTRQSRVQFTDQLQGEQRVQFGQDQGDFVVWRKDELPSYQLAVTVDDLDQGVTEVVRGVDLLQETAGQILLRQALSVNPLKWMHIPMLVNPEGDKLSKQTAAPPIHSAHAAQHLCDALAALGLTVEAALKRAAVRDIWDYAFEHWQPNKLFNKQKYTLDRVK